MWGLKATAIYSDCELYLYKYSPTTAGFWFGLLVLAISKPVARKQRYLEVLIYIVYVMYSTDLMEVSKNSSQHRGWWLWVKTQDGASIDELFDWHFRIFWLKLVIGLVNCQYVVNGGKGQSLKKINKKLA